MIPGICVQIETSKFPVLEGEEEELINQRTYGKALCQFLEVKLKAAGWEVGFYCCEDWGWWIEVIGPDCPLGLCVYNRDEGVQGYAVVCSVSKDRVWSWRRFRRVNARESVTKLMDDVESIFRGDPEIDEVSRLDEPDF